MVCSNCGADMKENDQFCINCGARAVQPAQVSNKQDFVAKVASKELKTNAKIAKILAIACAVLMLISFLVLINTSLQNIPLLSTIITMGAGDIDVFDEVMDEMDDYADQMEDAYDTYEDRIEDEFSEKEIKKLEKFIEATRKCSESLSIASFSNLISRYEDLASIDAEYIWGGIADDLEESRQAKLGITIYCVILFLSAMGNAAFLFFGGFFQKPVLAVLGTIGGFFYCLFWNSFLLALVVLAASIAMIVFGNRINKAYKAFRLAKANA